MNQSLLENQPITGELTLPKAKKKKRPKPFPASKTHPLRMGCCERGQPRKVIDNGQVFQYVGIGWVNEGEATEADYEKYPVLSDE